MEGAYAIKTGKLDKLAEQQLVSCSSHHGCDGGNMSASFKYLRDKGFNTAENYPYRSGEDHKNHHCHHDLQR